MEELKKYLEEYVPIHSDDWSLISSLFEAGSCTKNEILTQEGDIESHLYFITDGIYRFFADQENKEVTLNFGFAGDLVSCYSSFLTAKPTQIVLQALSEGHFYRLSKANLERIYESTSCGHQLGRVLTEQMFLYLSDRENSLLLQSPTERYLDLFEEQPRLIQEIPQKYLASYIGITPQALSRIRLKLSESN